MLVQSGSLCSVHPALEAEVMPERRKFNSDAKRAVEFAVFLDSRGK